MKIAGYVSITNHFGTLLVLFDLTERVIERMFESSHPLSFIFVARVLLELFPENILLYGDIVVLRAIEVTVVGCAEIAVDGFVLVDDMLGLITKEVVELIIFVDEFQHF